MDCIHNQKLILLIYQCIKGLTHQVRIYFRLACINQLLTLSFTVLEILNNSTTALPKNTTNQCKHRSH